MILVSHDLDMVTSECDRTVWLEHGQIEAVGPSKEVVARYRRDATPDAVGEHHAELLDPAGQRRLRNIRRRR